MDERELSRKIDEAKRTGRLYLCFNQLTELPPEIVQLTNLTELDLSFNQLTELPPEIAKMTRLTSLDLRSNQLTELPPEIDQLTNLAWLDLSDNQLTELPPEIAKMISITWLHLRYNQLKKLPREIAKLTSITWLYLRSNQLTELPTEIAQLTDLTELDFGSNQLTELPPEVAQLTNLTELDLSDNQLIELPPEIAQLTSLTWLDLSDNQLTELPPEIVQLTSLTELGLRSNQLTELPPEIVQLTSLTELDLSSNQLTELPPEIAQLTDLTELDFGSNQLTELPPEVGRLTKLEHLYLDGSALTSPPPEIVDQGQQAVLTYLREQLKSNRRHWVSKLLVVGEGGVGKSELLVALRGEEFDPKRPTTHGIEVRSLRPEHPTEAGVTMQLNTWDFGGQEIYHATHQFFMSSRSLFVLVWNARHGYEQGKLYYWLDAIQARAPESPILIVATHIDERDADLPFNDLKRKYPQIVGHYEVSNLTRVGIEEFREVLVHVAAELPLMGQNWPAHWLDAAEFIVSRKEKHITPSALRNMMADHDIPGSMADILARWLHELGNILYFRDDEDLNELVILKPQWVTEYISKVLESEEVIGRLGIFTSGHMRELWGDLDPIMQDQFLRLMERFDLSYRTLENREISLVVERLPLDPPPNYAEQWDHIKEAQNCREISMRFRLNTIPPGIPTWFIARSHRFTTHIHWRNGALLAYDEERKHLALVQAFPHDRYIQLTVRGAEPHNFFALLRDGIEVTLARFPGLNVNRMIPCPGHNGKPCGHEFNYAHLQRAIEKVPPVEQIQCPVSFEPVMVSDLLFGIHFSTQDAVLNRIDELEATLVEKDDAILAAVGDLLELAQREFTNIYRREQAVIDSHCPNVFVLRPRDIPGWKEGIVGREMELQLYCQAPGCWHFYGKPYRIKVAANWIRAVAPYLQKMVGMMKYVAPLAGPWVAVAFPEYEKIIKNDIKLMTELVKKLPDLRESREVELLEGAREIREPERVGGAALRAIRQLLDQVDPEQHWGGLRKVLTPEGHYLWLCEYHAKECRL